MTVILPTTARAIASSSSRRSSSDELSPSVAAAVDQVKDALACGQDVLLGCEDSLEGILTAVGITYLAHAAKERVRLEFAASLAPRIGEQIVDSPEDIGLASRVYAGLERHLAHACPHARGGMCNGACGTKGSSRSSYFFETGGCVRKIAYASLSDSPDMPQKVYEYVRLCFAEGNSVRNDIANPHVIAMNDLASYVLGECEHTRQFARFEQLQSGLYFCLFHPRANTLPATAGYFRARMGKTPFCMLDPNHAIGVFSNERLVVTKLDPATVQEMKEQGTRISDDERYVQEMWRTFYDKMTLAGRDPSMRGYDLRTHWMPKRFWRDMPDMAAHDDLSEVQTPLRYRNSARSAHTKVVPPQTGGTTNSLPSANELR